MKAVWAAEEMTPAGERWEGSRIAANAGKRDVAGVAAAVKRRDMTMMGVGVWSGKATLTVPA